MMIDRQIDTSNWSFQKKIEAVDVDVFVVFSFACMCIAAGQDQKVIT
jgi:hypothetical protein